MNRRVLIGLVAGAALCSGAAFAQNPVGGAVGGAVVGGAVGGPVGAAVGAGVGATVGSFQPPPDEVVTYVERERVPSVTVKEKVVVGEPLPKTVVLHEIPKHKTYSYAVVNEKRVIVEPRSRKIVKIIE
jgi:hypothetical protein